MQRLIVLLAGMLTIVGCGPDGQFRRSAITSGPCGNVSGYTYTAVAYGDSHLIVVPVSHIRPNTEWRFYLRPKRRGTDPAGVDYRNVNVTITGKFPGASPPPDRNDWIDVPPQSWSGTTTPGRYLVECVPTQYSNGNPIQSGDQFEFIVKVDSVGELDPRADVE